MVNFYNTGPLKGTSRYDKRRVALVVTIIGAVFVGTLIFSAYTLWHNSVYSATISLSYAPTIASATMDGKPINAGDIKVEPGSHTIIVKKSGFADSSNAITAIKGQVTKLVVALSPSDSSTTDWYANHPEDQTINEAAGAQAADNSATKLQDTFPIASILPLTGPSYRADYGLSTTKSGRYAVFVTYYTDTGQQDARDAITSLGYNPSDYEIVYINGEN